MHPIALFSVGLIVTLASFFALRKLSPPVEDGATQFLGAWEHPKGLLKGLLILLTYLLLLAGIGSMFVAGFLHYA
jgi:hypothetical protein